MLNIVQPATMKIEHGAERRRFHGNVDPRSDACDRGVHGAPHPRSTGPPRGADLLGNPTTLGQGQSVEVGVLPVASLHRGHEAPNVRIEPVRRIDPP